MAQHTPRALGLNVCFSIALYIRYLLAARGLLLNPSVTESCCVQPFTSSFYQLLGRQLKMCLNNQNFAVRTCSLECQSQPMLIKDLNHLFK